MKRFLMTLLIVAVVVFLQFGCETPTQEDQGESAATTVRISGQVLNKETNTPVDSAVVRLLANSNEWTYVTDQNGQYYIELEVEGTLDMLVIAYKEGFYPDTTHVLAVPGRNIAAPTLTLQPTSQVVEESGSAASIVLFAQSASQIGVQESGAAETAELIFEVQDSSGHPVDLAHGVEVFFRVGSAPGGGEYVYPSSAKTSNVGQVVAYVHSGIRAGVVQVIAEASVGDTTIRSKPVAIAIHGGLPDSAHFSLAVEKLNFPGYNIYGLTNGITAYVGDKFGNPVKPGTAIYFTTTGGIIEGSALTNDRGEASVTLISAAPQPEHPVLGKGFATITAQTADENDHTIETSTLVLFSGLPQITLTPTSFNIPNGGSQTFYYTVSDQNGNPLAEGTSILVEVDGESVDAVGDLALNLPDTQSKSWTQFSFTVFDAVDTVDVAKPVSIKVTASGPNGKAKYTIGGVAN